MKKVSLVRASSFRKADEEDVQGESAEFCGLGDDDDEADKGSKEEHLGSMQWEVDQPISPMSLEAKFPSGHLFASLQRIRRTVNEYSSRLTEVGWFQSFKVQTLQALERRLKQYRGQVIGKHNLEVQVAFTQLASRVSGLLKFHKH